MVYCFSQYPTEWRGDISKVAPEDKESVEMEVKSALLQLIFNNLREEYDFDNKLVINPQFTSQNS